MSVFWICRTTEVPRPKLNRRRRHVIHPWFSRDMKTSRSSTRMSSVRRICRTFTHLRDGQTDARGIEINCFGGKFRFIKSVADGSLSLAVRTSRGSRQGSSCRSPPFPRQSPCSPEMKEITEVRGLKSSKSSSNFQPQLKLN